MKRLFRKRLILPLLLLTVIWWFVYPWIRNGSAEGSTQLCLISWNLMALKQYNRAGINGLMELSAFQPDVVCLQEFPFNSAPLQVETLKNMGLIHRQDLPYQNKKGIGLSVFSRWPITAAEHVNLPPLEQLRVASLVELDVEGRKFLVTTVHFPNSDIHKLGIRKTMKQEFLGPTMRQEQAIALTEWLKIWDERPMAVAGDFNTFPFSAAWRQMNNTFYDAFPIGSFATGTYQGRYDFEVKIDHIFLSDEVEVLETHIPHVSGSDHWPVVSIIKF